MISFKQYLEESTPTVHANAAGTEDGFTSDANAAGPVAGFDKKLFPGDEDLLDQGFQAPGETGQDRYNRFFGVIPVQKMNLDTKLDGEPSIDSMVAASKEFTDLMDKHTQSVVRKNLARFMGEATESQKCPEGHYWCHTDKKCKKIPKGKYVGPGGWLRSGHSHSHNGNGNGSNNGNGNGNGHSGNGNGGNGNGGGGNGGGGE